MHEGSQTARIKFLMALLSPGLTRFAVAEDDLAHGAEVLFGMKPAENLSRIGKQLGRGVPDPSRTVTQHHAPGRFEETAPGRLPQDTRREVREFGAGVRGGGACDRRRIGNRSGVRTGLPS